MGRLCIDRTRLESPNLGSVRTADPDLSCDFAEAAIKQSKISLSFESPPGPVRKKKTSDQNEL